MATSQAVDDPREHRHIPRAVGHWNSRISRSKILHDNFCKRHLNVNKILTFREQVKCSPVEAAALPEFLLELSYCGDTLCPTDGEGGGSPLYSEPIRGLPGRTELQLRCELFGAAGTYALVLRPAQSIDSNTLEPTPAYLKVKY